LRFSIILVLLQVTVVPSLLEAEGAVVAGAV
jgi:hypothetical protein